MSSSKTKRSPQGLRPADTETGATSTDAFLGGRINIVQPRQGHRAGSDAVFLAAAVPSDAKGLVLDAGAGVGVAGLCLLARVSGVAVVGAEIDAKLCALAETNAARNGFATRFTAINADVTASAKALRATGLAGESFDHVMANPPFHEESAVRAAPDPGRAAAHVMGVGDLAVWARFLTRMAAPKGMLTLIHRAYCLGELLALLDGRFGDIAIFPLFPKNGAPATRIILQGRKGSRASLRLLPGLVLHDSDGRYTDEAEAILRGGEALRL